jgi:hypothetical protein
MANSTSFKYFNNLVFTIALKARHPHDFVVGLQQMQGIIGIALHVVIMNFILFFKQGWIQQSNNQNATCRYCPKIF